MPTKEWFEENPKVSAYISKDLHQKLETWMKDKGIKKVSQALTEILEQFLHAPQTDQESNHSERIEILEGKVAAIESRFATVDSAIANIQSGPTVVQDRFQLSLNDIAKSSTEQSEQPTPAIETHKEDSRLNVDQNKPKSKSRMTNREVCEFTGLTYGQVEGRHKRETIIEEKGKVFTPIRKSGKPMWSVTKG